MANIADLMRCPQCKLEFTRYIPTGIGHDTQTGPGGGKVELQGISSSIAYAMCPEGHCWRHEPGVDDGWQPDPDRNAAAP